jgi:hypothetical protein
MLGLYKFNWDCGRMGDVEGIFIAEDYDIKAAYGKEIYFGEILGKHSEVLGGLNEGDIELITEDKNVVGILRSHCGDSISGYNPLDYLQED